MVTNTETDPQLDDTQTVRDLGALSLKRDVFFKPSPLKA